MLMHAFYLKVLLLDEITVDLDVLGRADLMTYLVEETNQRKATIIYVGLKISAATNSVQSIRALPCEGCSSIYI